MRGVFLLAFLGSSVHRIPTLHCYLPIGVRGVYTLCSSSREGLKTLRSRLPDLRSGAACDRPGRTFEFGASCFLLQPRFDFHGVGEHCLSAITIFSWYCLRCCKPAKSWTKTLQTHYAKFPFESSVAPGLHLLWTNTSNILRLISLRKFHGA